jgi:hypothetical protein
MLRRLAVSKMPPPPGSSHPRHCDTVTFTPKGLASGSLACRSFDFPTPSRPTVAGECQCSLLTLLFTMSHTCPFSWMPPFATWPPPSRATCCEPAVRTCSGNRCLRPLGLL